MASYNRVVASGLTDILNVPFPYLDATHVVISRGGVVVPPSGYTWLSSSQIKFTAGNPPAGTILLAQRVTPTEALVTFAPGNLDPADLNTATLQALFRAEEALSQAEDLLARAWVTAGYGQGSTIEVGAPGTVPVFNSDGSLSGNGPDVATFLDAVNELTPIVGSFIRYTMKPGDGAEDLQTAINGVPVGSRLLIRVPATEEPYYLGSTPSANGRIVSFDIDPGASFSGPGNLPLEYTNSSAGWRPENLSMYRTAGAEGDPVTTKSPVVLLRKVHEVISDAEPGYGPNSVVTVTMRKDAGEGFQSSSSAVFIENIDAFGNPTTSGAKGFTEALRVSSYVTEGATHALPYGAIIGAGNEPGTTVDIMLPLECDVQNNDADAPSLAAFNPGLHKLIASFNATSSGSKRPLAYYITNPSDWVAEPARPRAGYAVLGPVVESCFAAVIPSGLPVPVGLDFRYVNLTYAGVALGNGQSIRWQNAAKSADISAMYLDGGNNLVIGQGLDSASTRVLLQVYNQVNGQMELRKLEVDASNNLKALPL